MALVAWEHVCLPRSEGGLGIMQINAWNRAAFGKLLWKIIANEDCLWVKWVKTAYLKGKSIWAVEAKDDHPWSWKKLLTMRESFKEHIQYIVGDGRQLSLFYDNWMQTVPIRDSINSNIANWGSELKVRSWWSTSGEWCIPSSFCRRHPNIVQTMRSYSLSEIPDTGITQCAICMSFAE